MKIVFIVKYYDAYRSQFYNKLDNIDRLKYAELTQIILDDYFSFYSSLVNILNERGHRASLIIPNCEILKGKWAQENRLSINSDKDFILSYCKKVQPDHIFLNSNFEYYGEFLKELRSITENLFCWISCPFDENLDLRFFKTVFTLFPPHYEKFKEKKYNSQLVTAGFDTKVLEKLKHDKKSRYDLTFVGGIGGYHKKREKYLREIGDHTPLQMWGYGYRSDNIFKQQFKNLKYGKSFLQKYVGQAWGMEMFQILSDSKITLNIHGDIAQNYSVNMRLYEATGVGTLLLTDDADNLSELFIPDVEIVTFKNPDEAIEKYLYYSTHEAERLKIAEAGQKRTLENYNYKTIADIFIKEFQVHSK